MSLYRGYQAAGSVCSGGPTPGCKALMSWFLGAYKSFGARNDGIYNCRAVRGGTAPSVHGEGRAADLGCQASAAWAQKLANLLVANSAELGIQCVIFNRRIWSGAHPDAGWRTYSGVDPHTTHLHVELSRKAAAGLTVARIVAVLTPQEDELELTDAQLEKIAAAVWQKKVVKLTEAGAAAIGGEMKEGDLVAGQYITQWSPLDRRNAREDAARDDQLRQLVNDLAVSVAQLGRNAGTGGIDVGRLADTLAALLAERLPPPIAAAVGADLAARLQS